MAISVWAIKTDEDEKYVYYDYEFEALTDDKPRILRAVVGKIIIDKTTEEIQYELAPCDRGGHAKAAITAILRNWANGGKATFPERAALQA